MKYRAFVMSILLSLYLGLHNGNIALFQTGNPEPVQIYGIHIRSLPPEEQHALSSGIRIRDHLHLARLLENYLS